MKKKNQPEDVTWVCLFNFIPICYKKFSAIVLAPRRLDAPIVPPTLVSDLFWHCSKFIFNIISLVGITAGRRPLSKISSHVYQVLAEFTLWHGVSVIKFSIKSLGDPYCMYSLLAATPLNGSSTCGLSITTRSAMPVFLNYFIVNAFHTNQFYNPRRWFVIPKRDNQALFFPWIVEPVYVPFK